MTKDKNDRADADAWNFTHLVFLVLGVELKLSDHGSKSIFLVNKNESKENQLHLSSLLII